MKRLTETIVLATLITLIIFSTHKLEAAPGTGTLFGTDAGGDNLLTIDPTTGIGTVVGPMGTGGAPSLAIDPKTGKIYVGGGGGVPFIYEVNPSTGEATLIGDSGLGLGTAGIGAMDFSADDTLYASVNLASDGGTGPDHLAIIDKETGEATIIGPFGECTNVKIPSDGGGECTIEGMAGIAFDASGKLWGAVTARGATGEPGELGQPGLYTIDINTGEATFVLPILDSSDTPPSGGVGSLQFSCDGTLYGGTPKAIGDADDGGRLITIDPETGLFSFVRTAAAAGDESLGALAFQEPCIPCTLNLTLSSSDGTLNFDFEVSTEESATWNVWLNSQACVFPLLSVQLPEIDPPISFPFSLPFFPQLGTVGVLTTLTSPKKGIICSDWKTVNTGVPNEDNILKRRIKRKLQRKLWKKIESEIQKQLLEHSLK